MNLHKMMRYILSGLGIACILVILAVASTFPAHLHAQDALPRIIVDNVTQVRLLMSLNGQSAAFSPDGSLLASRAYNNPQVWNIRTGQSLPIDSPDQIEQWSADGTRLVLYDSASDMTRLWNIATQQEEVAVPGYFEALSPKNTHLVTRESTVLSLWDTQTGERMVYFDMERYSPPSQFSPDGTLFAWNGPEGTTRLWDVAANTELAAFPNGGHGYGVTFSPDGTLLATGGAEGGILWDVASLQQRARFCLRGDKLQFSLDGSMILTYSSNYNSFNPGGCISDTATGEILALFTGEDSGNIAQFSPDGSKLLYYSLQRSTVPLQIWDVSTRQFLQLPAELTNNVVGAQFGPDGTWFMVWQVDSTGTITAALVDMTTWATQNVPFRGNSPQFSPDGTTLVSQVENMILVYGVPTPQRPVGHVLIPGQIVSSGINLRSAPQPDAPIIGVAQGRVLASGRNGDFIYLPIQDGWVRAGADYIILAQNLPLEILPEITPAEAVAFIPTPTPTVAQNTPIPSATPTSSVPTPTLPPAAVATRPAVAEAAGGFMPISPENADQVRLLKVVPGAPMDRSAALLMSLSPDVRVWDWFHLAEIPLPQLPEQAVVAVSPDGSVLAYTADTSVVLWDIPAAREIAVLDGHTQAVEQLMFSPDGRLLATTANNPDFDAAADRSIRIWEAQTGILHSSFEYPARMMKSWCFSHDGSRLAAAYPGGPTYIWDTSTGALLHTLAEPAGYTVFSPDDTRVITMDGYYGEARLWNTASGQTKALFQSGHVGDVEFSPDQQTLLIFNRSRGRFSIDTSPGITLWDAFTAQLIADYPKGCNATFSADGKLLFVAEINGPLRVYAYPAGQEVAAFDVNWCGDLVFSPDNRLLGLGTALLDLTTWSLIPIPGTSYDSRQQCINDGGQQFSPDGSTLAVSFRGYRGYRDSTMFYGIPSAGRLEQPPIVGHVKTSGIHVHETFGTQSGILGTASGDIVITGRRGDSLYLPEHKGWVWADYVDLGEWTLTDIPVLWPHCVR